MRNVLTQNYDVHQGRPNANLGAYGLSQVTKMMGLADARSAPGSEINKQLVLQASDIASKVKPGINIDTDWRHGTGEGLAQNLLDVGGRDKIVVHDILTDTGVPTGTNTKVLDNLLHHEWANNGAGVQKMLSFVETDATNPTEAISIRAGQTATTVADYVASHKDGLLKLNGSGESLGQVNPLAAQGLGSALSPYVANLVGVPDRFLNTEGFKAPQFDVGTADRDAARAIFTVIDTNKDAAVAFNTRALETAQNLQSQWVQSVLADPANPHNELATKSGTILGLVDQGLSGEVDAHNKAEIRNAIKAFAQDGAAWDSGKGIVTTGVKMIPVVKDIFGPVIDVSNSYAKMNIVGLTYQAPDPAHANFDTSHDFAPARALYQVAQVLETRDGSLAHDPRYSDLFSDGKLKSYPDAVKVSGDPHILDSSLTNILNSYQGGVLHEHLQDFMTKMQEGRDAVR
ncbi:hypothetical protein JMUB6875_58300 [Nocardia sp. JMUB6875]|uniref:TPR repeat region-containing protein n=1 Tax=Nocardia sp. JMUB6875 TaxID=3158170 RepID=UPI0032E72305